MSDTPSTRGRSALVDPFVSMRPHNDMMLSLRTEVSKMEPDREAVWDPEDRRRLVEYIAWRDEDRCGLCYKELVHAFRDSDIEHVIPKRFGFFDITTKGRAQAGSGYESRLHHPDNLQLAHPYCNAGKGNTPVVQKWRHPSMFPLPAACRVSDDGYLWCPGHREPQLGL